jgi:integrase
MQSGYRVGVRTITQKLVEGLSPGQRVWDDRVRGFCVRCQGRAKSFGLQLRIHGKQRWLTLGPWGVLTVEEARQQARVLAGRVASGEDIAVQRQRAKALPTVDGVADIFVAQHVRVKLKPQVAAEYERLLRSCIRSGKPQPRVETRGRPSRKRTSRTRLGEIRIDAVTGADVVRFHTGLSEVPYEANRALAVLSKLMAFAEDLGLRPRGSNPCGHVARYREQARERYLTLEEFAHLSEVLDAVEGAGKVSPFAIAAIRLLILTGARRDEIRTLQWSHIDRKRNMAFLPDSKTGRKVIHLSDPALDLLDRLPRIEGNAFVFAGGRPSGSGMHVRGQPIRDLQGPWENIRALAGFPGLRMHDLRHSYASLLAASGTPLLVIGKLLGHKHVATTARYAHLSEDPLRLANARLGHHLAAAFGGSFSKDRA